MNPDQLILRDIHLPPPVSWWPPAPGWWGILALAGLLTLLGSAAMRRRRQRRYQRLALTQLHQLGVCFAADQDAGKLLQQLSLLLHQLAVLHFPASDCAALHGEAWLQFLDRPFPDQPFSGGVGRCLGDGPYQRQSTPVDGEALLRLCRRWLQQLPAPSARLS